jgi:hypothetical protein
LYAGQAVRYGQVCAIINTVNGDGNSTIDLDKTLSSSDLVDAEIKIYPHTASGESSHAEGKATTTLGEATHAEGMGTIANGMCQHAQGRYNIEDTGNNYLHIVGNGENEGNRSNAHTIDWGGNGWFAGKVTADDIVIEGEIGSLLTYVRELETRISALES